MFYVHMTIVCGIHSMHGTIFVEGNVHFLRGVQLCPKVIACGNGSFNIVL